MDAIAKSNFSYLKNKSILYACCYIYNWLSDMNNMLDKTPNVEYGLELLLSILNFRLGYIFHRVPQNK